MNPNIQIREGFATIDCARVQAWLAATYWQPGVVRAVVEHQARNSALVIGAFTPDGLQIGYARVVSDKSRFGYLCDVVVDEAHRGKGIGRAMVQFALKHPEHSTVTTWILKTRDAHGVYSALEFLPITNPVNHPEAWMALRPAENPQKAR